MVIDMKVIGYLIFAGFFYLFRLFCSVKPKKVFGIMTHDGSRDGNVGVMMDYLKKMDQEYTFHYLKKADSNAVKKLNIFTGKVSFFIEKPYQLATSEFILMDNTFLPMAYLKFSDKVKVIQLWHGTGTIKRFGQDVNTGRLKELERRANKRITHLIVNSEDTKKEYAGAFGVSEDKVFIYGLPRTDVFFFEELMEERRVKFFAQYPQFKNKKLVLYAPTFRDQEKDDPKLKLDVELLSKQLPEDYILLLRLHPFVMEAYQKATKSLSSFPNIVPMSDYADINTLLVVADYLITDYSSVLFEFCLLEKPMLFYAYDLDDFSDNGRGFYRAYGDYVPGPIVEDTSDVLELLLKDKFDLDRIKRFKDKNYKYLDGKAAERIYLKIFRKAFREDD
jgi:CDP-ribitol ribitolphosphotransferase